MTWHRFGAQEFRKWLSDCGEIMTHRPKRACPGAAGKLPLLQKRGPACCDDGDPLSAWPTQLLASFRARMQAAPVASAGEAHACMHARMWLLKQATYRSMHGILAPGTCACEAHACMHVVSAELLHMTACSGVEDA